MLDFLDRHKAGILGTIIIHLVLATVILVMKINSIQTNEKALNLNVLNEEEVKQLLDPEENKEQQAEKTKELFSPSEKAMLGMKNMGTNEAEKSADDKINQMVNDIKGELNIKDPSPSDRQSQPQEKPDENALPDKSQKEEKVNVTKLTGVRTFYKGPTSVSYFLDGRYHVSLPIPVYKCETNGKVVYKIEVNQQGYIDKLEINRAESKITDDCILETSEKYARSTRFNPSTTAPAVQKGTLTYIFVAQ